jgi:hypothetical protein
MNDNKMRGSLRNLKEKLVLSSTRGKLEKETQWRELLSLPVKAELR